MNSAKLKCFLKAHHENVNSEENRHVLEKTNDQTSQMACQLGIVLCKRVLAFAVTLVTLELQTYFMKGHKFLEIHAEQQNF